MDNQAIPSWTNFLHLSDRELVAQCEVNRFRASGPGGQKRNKTDSAVRLRHRPTGLAVEAVESRSQHENRERALRRLRMTIAVGARGPSQTDEVPRGELAEALRVGKGRRVSMGRRDQRYPPVVAMLFDRLEGANWELGGAAPPLGITARAVGRFLEADPLLWRTAQQRRAALGLPPLRSAR